MQSDEQITVLCDIGQSVAFSDDRQGLVQQLLIDGYVIKNGDLYELSAQGAGRRRRPSGSGPRDRAVTCLAVGQGCGHTDRPSGAFQGLIPQFGHRCAGPDVYRPLTLNFRYSPQSLAKPLRVAA